MALNLLNVNDMQNVKFSEDNLAMSLRVRLSAL